MKEYYLPIFVLIFLPSFFYAQKTSNKDLPYTLDQQYTSFNIRFDKSYKPDGNQTRIILNDVFKPSNDITFQSSPSTTDELGMTHTLITEYFKNIPVYGGEILAHEKNNKLTSINGSYIPLTSLSVNPILTEAKAIQNVIGIIKSRQQEHSLVKNDSTFSLSNFSVKKIIAPLKGDKKSIENYRVAFQIIVSSFIPFSNNFIIDAQNGNVLFEFSNRCGTNANGTGDTYYNGTKPIITDYTGSLYRLKETGTNRNIGVYDLHGEEIGQYTSILADYFTNSDNTWTSGYYLKQVKINSTDDWGSLLDAQPDYFFKLKNSSGNVVYTSKVYSNQSAPKTIPVYTRCVSPPCTIEIYDEDPISDDLLATIPLTLSNGTHNYTNGNNNIDYIVEFSGNPAIDVYWGVENSLDYYRTQFQRYSYDGSSSKVNCYLNVSDDESGGLPSNSYASADDYLVFGMGGALTPVLGAPDKPHVGLDVVGHEFTHMVVAHNGHGGLPYYGETGALNESFADIFGTCIEFWSSPGTANWEFGELDFPSSISPYHFRSLENPNDGFYSAVYTQFDLRQPDTYNGLHWGDPAENHDNGNVHKNSGVQNFWFYLLANQSSGNMTGTNDVGYNYNVTCIGIDHASKIAYRNLTTYLTPSATYYDAALGSINSAIDLYGAQSQEKSSVIQAWYAVGVVSNPNTYCTGTVNLNATDGTFNDGSGNHDYQNNNDCKWLIHPNGATDITLSFSFFNVENGHDSVIVYDGGTTSSTVLGSFTGTTLPNSLTSTGGNMLVRFKTDNATGGQGWIANYTSSISPGTGCSGTVVLNSSTGTVSDGSGTGNYANNSDCSWSISPPGAVKDSLVFTAFDLLPGDTLFIHNGNSTAFPLLGKYTGSSLPVSQVANSGSMFLHFVTNASGVSQGWSATYTSTGSAYCSGVASLTSSSGTITDGSGANSYQNNSDCKWYIHPLSATSITLNFSQFDVEPPAYNNLGTIYDWVKVFDGINETAPLLGTFYGSQIPPQIISSSGNLFLWFHTDGATVRPGWQANYTSNTSSTCSGTQMLTASNGNFTDGSGAGNYATNMDCRWQIQPANATSILLSFSSFNLESNNDAVIIYNGPSTSSPILGTYSGSNLPPSVTSTVGTMLVRMITNGSVNMAGFSASYSANISPIGNHTIVGYEYWYDTAYANATFINTTPVYDLQLNTNLQAQSLSSGMHILNIRFIDNNDKWSSVLSSFIIKYPNSISQSKNINGYEYWFDGDYANKVSQTVSPQQSFSLSTPLNMTGLTDGMHILNIRFKDDGNFWSSVLSSFVIKYPSGANPNKLITEYEYWFDGDYANKVNQSVTPQISHILNTGLSVENLASGMHTLNIRFKDDGSFWSSVLSSFFIRNGTGAAIANKITAYRYWYDTTYANMTTVVLPTPVNPYDLITNINTSSLSAGNHTVHFQFKDSINLWSGVTNDTFNNVVGPHANFIANDTTICYSGTVSFSNLSTNATSYQWTFGDGGTSTLTNPTHNYTTAGLYSVRLIAIGSSNTSDTLTRSAYIRVILPNITVSPNTSVCPGGSVTLLASGASSYLWYPASSLNTSTGTSVIATPASNTTYNVVGTDQYGCLDTAQVAVSVSNIVTVSISPPTVVSICSGNSVNLAASGANSYSWYPSVGLSQTTGASVSASPVSTTVYYVIGTATCGVDTENITINVNPIPLADAGNDATICLGQSANLLASGGTTYLWSNGTSTAPNQVQPLTTLTYTVTVTQNNCSATDDVTINVNPRPDIMLNDTAICTGSTIILDANNIGSTYLWNDASTSQTNSVSLAGTYTVTVTNSFACTASASAIISVSNNLNVELNDTAICQGRSVVLNAGYTGSSYQWSNSSNSQTINVTTGGTYSVTVTHPSGCTGADTAVVTVNQNPTANAGDDVEICYGEQAVLIATGGTLYGWNNGVNTASNTVSPQSTASYIVTVQNAFACTLTDTVTVTVNQLPSVSLSNLNDVCENATPFTLTGGTPNGGVYSGLGVSSGSFSPSIAGVGTHTVTYTYADANGCTDSAHTQINVTVCTGLSQSIKGALVSVYPNPTVGMVTLSLKNTKGVCNVEIINTLGQSIFSDNYTPSTDFSTKFDLSLFSDGLYYFKIGVEGSFKNFKILKTGYHK